MNGDIAASARDAAAAISYKQLLQHSQHHLATWGSLGFCVAGQEEALGEALVEELEGSRSRIAAKSGRVWPFLAQKLVCAAARTKESPCGCVLALWPSTSAGSIIAS